MIDLNKSYEYFDPDKIPQPVNIVGCGALGSHMAEMLTRLGVQKFVLYDDDIVSSHNIANQNFIFDDIGKPKVQVVADRIKAINPDAQVIVNNCRLEKDGMAGMVGTIVACVDSIEPRKMLAQYWNLTDATWYVDVRMALTSGTAYVYKDFYKFKAQKDNYLNTECNFSDADADANTPVTACGFTLSVLYSIWGVCALAERMLINAITDNKVASKGYITFDGQGFISSDIYNIQ